MFYLVAIPSLILAILVVFPSTEKVFFKTPPSPRAKRMFKICLVGMICGIAVYAAADLHEWLTETQAFQGWGGLGTLTENHSPQSRPRQVTHTGGQRQFPAGTARRTDMLITAAVFGTVLCFLLSPPLLWSLKTIKSRRVYRALMVVWMVPLLVLMLLLYVIAKSRLEQGLPALGPSSPQLNNLLYVGIFSAVLVCTSPRIIRKQIKKDIPRNLKIILWVVRVLLAISILVHLVDLF